MCHCEAKVPNLLSIMTVKTTLRNDCSMVQFRAANLYVCHVPSAFHTLYLACMSGCSVANSYDYRDISREKQAHQRAVHPYQPFPLARVLEAVQSVPLSAYPLAERRLAEFGCPVRFRCANRCLARGALLQSHVRVPCKQVSCWSPQDMPRCELQTWRPSSRLCLSSDGFSEPADVRHAADVPRCPVSLSRLTQRSCAQEEFR